MTTTVSALVIDQKAIGILDRAFVEDAWLQKFEVPQNTDGLSVMTYNVKGLPWPAAWSDVSSGAY